jgi:hypothetical protein
MSRKQQHWAMPVQAVRVALLPPCWAAVDVAATAAMAARV